MFKVFDYKCETCNTTEERYVKMHDGKLPLQVCEECKRVMRKMPSAPPTNWNYGPYDEFGV